MADFADQWWGGSSGVPSGGAAPQPDAPQQPMGPLWQVTRPSYAYGWTRTNRLWNSLDDNGKAAAMSLMEADSRNPKQWYSDATDVAGAIINRAAKNGESLGGHVSQKIYQPTMEWTQEARLPRLVQTPEFQQLSDWIARRSSGLEPDPVNGATHYLAHANVMLNLWRQNPSYYPIQHWGKWSGFDPSIGDYRDKLYQDTSHSFVAPRDEGGAYSLPYLGGSQPQDALNTDNSNPLMNASLAQLGSAAMAPDRVDPKQLASVNAMPLSTPTPQPAAVQPDQIGQTIKATSPDPIGDKIAEVTGPGAPPLTGGPGPAPSPAPNPAATPKWMPDQIASLLNGQGGSGGGFTPPMKLGGPVNMASAFDWSNAFNNAKPFNPVPVGSNDPAPQNTVVSRNGAAVVGGSQNGIALPGALSPAVAAAAQGVTDPSVLSAIESGVGSDRAKVMADQLQHIADSRASSVAFTPLEGVSKAFASAAAGYERGKSFDQQLAQRKMMASMLTGGGDPYTNILNYTLVANPEKAADVAAQAIAGRREQARYDLAAKLALGHGQTQGAVSLPAQAGSPQSGGGAAMPSVPGTLVTNDGTPYTPPPIPAAPQGGAAPQGAAPAPGGQPVGTPPPFPGAPANAPPGAPGPTANSGQIPLPTDSRTDAAAAGYLLMDPKEEGKVMAEQEGQQARQNQQIQANRAVEQTKLDTEMTDVYAKGPDGSTVQMRIPRSQVPAFMQQHPDASTAGKPVLTPEQEALSKSYGDAGAQLLAGRDKAVDLNGRLSQMQANLANFTPGKGANFYYDMAAWMASTLPKGTISDDQLRSISSYQDFQKLATQYATEQARQLGAREAASVVQIMLQSNPNAEMTGDALRRIMGGLRASNDYAVAKANAYEDWMKTHNSMSGFERDFQSKTTPEQFLLPYLTAQDIKSMPDEVLKRINGANGNTR